MSVLNQAFEFRKEIERYAEELFAPLDIPVQVMLAPTTDAFRIRAGNVKGYWVCETPDNDFGAAALERSKRDILKLKELATR